MAKYTVTVKFDAVRFEIDTDSDDWRDEFANADNPDGADPTDADAVHDVVYDRVVDNLSCDIEGQDLYVDDLTVVKA